MRKNSNKKKKKTFIIILEDIINLVVLFILCFSLMRTFLPIARKKAALASANLYLETVKDALKEDKNAYAYGLINISFTAKYKDIKLPYNSPNAGLLEVNENYQITRALLCVDTYKIEFTKDDIISVVKGCNNMHLPDHTGPDILGVNDKNISVGEVFDPKDGVSVIDNFDGKISLDNLIIKGDVSFLKPGEYSLAYEVSDKSGNKTTKTRTITVTESNMPVINGLTTKKVVVGTNFDPQDGVSIINKDKERIALTNLKITGEVDVNKIGNYQLVYEVSDLEGKTTKVRDVEVVDVTAPTISGADNMAIPCGSDFDAKKGVTINDEVDGVIANTNLKIDGDVNVNIPGYYNLTYEISDNSGNKSRIKREVTVLYTDKSGASVPKLQSPLVPIKWENNHWVVADKTKKWYDYDEKWWANAVILNSNIVKNAGDILNEDEIKAYFVWIPKFSYQLFNLGNYTRLNTTPIDNVRTISLSFANPKSLSGKVLEHPAFTSFNVDGFWIGKFETTGTANIPTIKPGIASLRNLRVKTMFESAYNFERSLDSHMLKNTEWGAVSYLAHSKYGLGSEVRINNNSNYLTGTPCLNNNVCKSYEALTAYSASTTGNIYGVYDMSGGAYEYTSSYLAGNYAKSGFTSENISKYQSKYFDLYSGTTATSYKMRILGDATGEMGPFYETDGIISSWYQDSAKFVDNSGPWFLRGGAYYSGKKAGIFAFTSDSGGADESYGFRIALAF